MNKRVISLILSVLLLMTLFAVPSFASDIYQPKADGYTWTEWSTSMPPSGADYDTKTQYRYRDKKTVTNGYYSYSGYTRSASTLVSTSSGNWYTNAQTTSDKQSSTYRTIVSNESKSVYSSFVYVCNCKSWFWKNNKGSHKSGCTTKNLLKLYSSKSLSGAGFSYDSSDGSYKVPKKIGTSYPDKFGTVYLTTYNGNRTSYFTSAVSCTYLWKSSSNTATIYRPVTKKYQYTHYKWGDWTTYADSYVASSNNREVQTRTLYRYKVYNQSINCVNNIDKKYSTDGFYLNASADTALSYSSSNTDIATVSGNGYVTMKKAGTVTITIKAAATATYNAATKKVTLNISKASPNLYYDGSTQISKPYSTNGFSVAATARNSVSYSSSNTAVLTVSNTGWVTMKKAGTATITMKTPSSDKYTVETKKVKVTITKAAQTITCSVADVVNKKYGNSAFNLGAKSKTSRTYTTSNKNIATVSSAGKVTIKNPGTVTITIKAAATTKYKAATKKIQIKIALNTPNLTVTGNKDEDKVRNATLKWKKVAGADGYVIYSPDYESDKGKQISVGANVTTKTQPGLKANKTYRYRIRAFSNVNGKKVYSPYTKYKTVYFEE